jgi:F-type H+-transporting ATPase subunit delta
MKTPRESRRLAREMLAASMAGGRLDEAKARALAGDLAAKKPRYHVATLKEFVRLLRLEISKRHAVVEAAVEPDALVRLNLERDLKSKYGPEVTVEYRSLPALIGGLRVRIGSDVWDGTVRGRLERLRDSLAAVS